jgi:hypothetical protein
MASTTQRDLDPGQFPQLKTMFTNFKVCLSAFYAYFPVPLWKPAVDRLAPQAAQELQKRSFIARRTYVHTAYPNRPIACASFLDANTLSGKPLTDIYYGVYFYPYTKPGVDPVFAAVGGQEVLQPSPADPFAALEHAFSFFFFRGFRFLTRGRPKRRC